MVIPSSNPSLLRMVRNIPSIKLVTVNTLNLVDVVGFSTVIFEKDAVSAFEQLYRKTDVTTK
jgi:ribosomal protein L4